MDTNANILPSQHRQAGFSLIELMIVVVIIAVISAVAIPNYSNYVIRGKIPEATSQLAVRQVQMEQFFQDNRTYVGGPACTADTTTSKYFDFSCGETPSTTAYTLTATGKDSMTGFSFTVNQTGAKTTASVPTGWDLPNPNTCWVTKKGGAC